MPRKLKLLSIAVVLVFGLTVLLAWRWHSQFLPNESLSQYLSQEWRTWRYGDLLERESSALSGTAARDCGRARWGENVRAVNDCAMMAFRAKKLFRARWQLLGIDGEVWDGIVSTPNGRLYQLQFLVGPFVPGTRLVQKYECPTPFTLREDSGHLTCFSYPK